MPPEQMQPQGTPQQGQVMTPEETKAALGNSTYLVDQMLSQQNPQEAPAEAPQEEIEQEPMTQEDVVSDEPIDEGPTLEEALDAKFDDFKKETEKTIKSEMEGIKSALKDALDDK